MQLIVDVRPNIRLIHMRYSHENTVAILLEKGKSAFTVIKPPQPTEEEITIELNLRERLDAIAMKQRRKRLKDYNI